MKTNVCTHLNSSPPFLSLRWGLTWPRIAFHCSSLCLRYGPPHPACTVLTLNTWNWLSILLLSNTTLLLLTITCAHNYFISAVESIRFLLTPIICVHLTQTPQKVPSYSRSKVLLRTNTYPQKPKVLCCIFSTILSWFYSHDSCSCLIL